MNSLDNNIVTIVEPTKDVFDKADYYIKLIKTILPDAKVTLIGSLAIPVCIKNEIDLLVEINSDSSILIAQEKVRDNSGDIFGIGPIVNEEGYSRSKKKFGIICELHFLHSGDARIDKYFSIIKRFKSDQILREKYNSLKWSLNGAKESVYKEEKRKFFRSFLV